MIDENLDLSASLFDQHTLFSQILTMKFFDRIKDIKLGFLGTKNYITFGHRISVVINDMTNYGFANVRNPNVSNVKRDVWFESNQH